MRKRQRKKNEGKYSRVMVKSIRREKSRITTAMMGRFMGVSMSRWRDVGYRMTFGRDYPIPIRDSDGNRMMSLEP